MEAITVLGIAGSLREGSYNKLLLKNAQALASSDIEINIFDLKDIALFNEDLEAKVPDAVVAFRDAIAKSDAMLIAAPEYSRSYSGVLKNALDWASRKYDNFKPLEGKPVAYMGASPSGFGSARAQNQLKGLLTTLGMHVYNGGVEVMVSKADEQFDERGGLKDERLKQGVRDLLVGLRDWTKRLST